MTTPNKWFVSGFLSLHGLEALKTNWYYNILVTVRKVIAQVYEATLNLNLARLLVEKKKCYFRIGQVWNCQKTFQKQHSFIFLYRFNSSFSLLGQTEEGLLNSGLSTRLAKMPLASINCFLKCYFKPWICVSSSLNQLYSNMGWFLSEGSSFSAATLKQL